jgi:hypothetical protein
MISDFNVVLALPRLINALYTTIANLFTKPIMIGVSKRDFKCICDIVNSGVLNVPVLRHKSQVWAHMNCSAVLILCNTKKDLERCDLALTKGTVAEISALLKEVFHEEDHLDHRSPGDEF